MPEPRSFEARDAVRDQVPLLVGLMGPSGGGKTFSALRLATGIQKVRGGEIAVIDTEAKRALHYADKFRFKHIEFKAPFGSLDYLAALRYAADVSKGGVIIADSMSHEHEGEGGYLELHDKEVQRMSGGDAAKAERVKMAGWIRPAAERRKLINGLLQINAAFIFCFRAKEKTKPKKGGGIEELGFMPIAGDEFLFEMTLNALLLPNAGGVPTWRSDSIGERMMIKLPEQFKGLFADERPLDENHGKALALWAKGDGTATPAHNTARAAEPTAGDTVLDDGWAAAEKGMASLQNWWGTLSNRDKARLKTVLDDELKATAQMADDDPFGLPPLKQDQAQAAPADDVASSEFADTYRRALAACKTPQDVKALMDRSKDAFPMLPEPVRAALITESIARERALDDDIFPGDRPSTNGAGAPASA